MILPDISWNRESVDELHYIAIIKHKNVKTLRDLNSNHLEMLKVIDEKGKETISKRHSIDCNNIISFVHYYPTYYHFHIHFMNIMHPSAFEGKNHYIHNIIQNIKICSDYYQKVDIQLILPVNHQNLNIY